MESAASKVRAARPQIGRLLVAAIAIGAGEVLTSIGSLRRATEASDRVFEISGAVLILLGGVLMVRTLAGAARRTTVDQLGDARGATLAFVLTVVGYVVVLLLVLSSLEVKLQGLLLGGAITGIVIGIAAQQTMANFFAGLVLLIVRPLNVGEHLVMRSGPLGGEYEGRVTDMSLFYVRLMTENGPVSLPNSGVLASAIGPGARAPKEDEEDEPIPEGAGGAPDHSRGSG